ncbi:MAG: DDE-type integrase/transposase/recombinase [Methylovulum sp.]|nr:DDE-type integrase/transposase/recombinase [Methylovulum sp.]
MGFSTNFKVSNVIVVITFLIKFNVMPVCHRQRLESLEDLKCGRRPGQGGVLADEAVTVETRRKTLLPLDDLLDLLQPEIPAPARPNLHRCLQRHGISRLGDLLPDEGKAAKPFKAYKPGFLHIDTAQINLGKDKWYLSVAIDRATRYVYLELHDNKRMDTATAFLGNALAQYPFKVEKILTDNGMEFSYNPLPENKKPNDKEHPFAALCKGRQIGHRTTLARHPWTNGMVEATDKKAKANTTKRFHYEDVGQLKTHLYHYLLNYTTT